MGGDLSRSLLPKQAVKINRTTLMTIGLLAFLVGLGLTKFGVRGSLIAVIVSAIVCVITAYRRRWPAILSVILFGLCVGLWRGTGFLNAIGPYGLLYDHKVVLRVVASEDATYGKNSQLSFDSGKIEVVDPVSTKLPGRVKILGFGEYMVYRGDTVEVQGKIYKVRGGRQGQVSFATIKVIRHSNSWVDKLRQKFTAGMQSALPEPLASFGLGLLIGQRSTIPTDVSSQLAAVGLTHLVAVSGYNLTIIVDATRRITGKRSKYQSFMLASLLIGVFLLVTGLSASIVRAAIVSMLSLSAWYYGRRIKPLLLISIAAGVTAIWNPLYLWGDISWYLSFLAFFGVIVVAPLITRRIYGDQEPKLLHSILIETTCAQVMTLPYILYIFQQTSIVSILSNLIVVPMVPIAMLVSLIAGLSGAYLPLVSGWLSWPGRLVLTYMLDVAALLSKAPHALIHGALTIYGLVSLYIIILAIVWVLWRKNLANRGIITDIDTD